jgi:ubiquinone/menaquinone biosynthesis C-methylase UbiE
VKTIEHSYLAGNIYNKQRTKNSLARLLIHRYYHALEKSILSLNIKMCLDVGCGEGWISAHIKNIKKNIIVNSCDISDEIIKVAIMNNRDINFFVPSVYHLPFRENSFDLIVACEVLEHLEYPHDAIKEIKRVSNSLCLFSVPIEPLWRILNILRGAYLKHFGNTIGHIQHWTKKQFTKVLIEEFKILKKVSP